MSKHPVSILLVDEDKTFAESFRGILENQQVEFDLSIAPNLREARGYLERSLPDLVVTEWLLPDGKGIKLLSEDPDGLDYPLVVITNHDDLQVVVEAMKAGASDYILKSEATRIDIPQLLKRLRKNRQGVAGPEHAFGALRQSEEKFRQIVEQLHDGIVVTNEEGVILEWNHNQERITGLKRDDVIGKDIWDVRLLNTPEEQRTPEFYEQFKQNRTEKIERIKSKQQTWSDELNEIEIQHPDGTRLMIQSLVFRVVLKDGFLIVSVVRDITESKRAGEALKVSEERFRKFTSAITDVIYRYNPIDDSYDFISPSFELQTGYSVEELKADPSGITKKITHPDDVDRASRAVNEHIRKGSGAGPVQVEYRVVRKDGRIIWVNDRKDFEFGSDGWANRINGIVRDITKRKQAEERLDSLLRSLPDTILYQTGGGVEYVSSNVSSVIGYDAEEIIGDRTFFPSLIHPDDQERVRCTHQSWLKIGADGIVEVEFRVRLRDGTYKWLLDRMVAAFVTQDERYSYMGVMIDITSRKQVEEEREKLISELQEALSKIKVLSGLVPICAHCKKIRDDSGYWNQLEDYMTRHSDMVFSHGTCPECARKLYPDYYKEEDKNEDGN